MMASFIQKAARLGRGAAMHPDVALQEVLARLASPLRYTSMHAPTLLPDIHRRERAGRARPRIFNLDLHISVIADIAVELHSREADLTCWSISGHNHVTRRLFKRPDPVHVINQRTWRDLDENMIDRFNDRYGSYLKSFDGFVACFTPAFAEIYRLLEKPTLVVSATRYEAPYTTQQDQWLRLNDFLRTQVARSRMILVANNRADRDYMRYHLGLAPRYVPSVCDYTGSKWSGDGGPKWTQSRSQALSAKVHDASGGAWLDGPTVLPKRHSWSELMSSADIFVVPYNVSTMTMFELATAGVPVSVPSPRFLKELMTTYEGILSELTWFQVLGVPSPTCMEDPSNEARPDFIDWWLDRADFYDADLMPNARLVDSFEELISTPHPVLGQVRSAWSFQLSERLERIRSSRAALVTDFLAMM